MSICEVGTTGGCSGAPLVTFSGEGVQVVPDDEHYIVQWHSRETGVLDAGTYRVSVHEEGTVLGYADVRFGGGTEAGQESLTAGQTVPIKFRIEQGAIPAARALVPPGGAAIALEGYASVEVPAGAFTTERAVRILATSSDEVGRDFVETVPVFGAARAPWELRMIVDGSPPTADISVTLPLPAAFSADLPPGHEPALWMEVFQDDGGMDILDGFVRLPAIIDDGAGVLRAMLPPQAFTDRRRTDGAPEAIIILGSAPVASLSGVAAAMVLTTDPARCEGPELQPPLVGDLNVNSDFNPDRKHYGTDYEAGHGDPVLAAGDGTIEKVGFDERPLNEPDPRSGLTVKGWGRYVRIRHDDGSSTLYAHLDRQSTDHLTEGQRVSAGAQLGEADNTGGSAGPHLHLEQRKADGTRLDPNACIARGPGQFSGIWHGDYFGANDGFNIGPGSWTWDLSQSGTSVTGSVDLGGVLMGTVSGNTLTLLIAYPNGATNEGAVTLSGNTVSGILVLRLDDLVGTFHTTLTRVSALTGAPDRATLSANATQDRPVVNPDGTVRQAATDTW